MKKLMLIYYLLFLGSSVSARKLTLARIHNIRLGFKDSIISLCDMNENELFSGFQSKRQKDTQPQPENKPLTTLMVPKNIIIFGMNDQNLEKKYEAAQALSNQTNSPYIFASSSEIITSESPTILLDQIFRDAHRVGPGILFLDKFDLVLSKENLLNTIISFLENNRKLLVIMACHNFDLNTLPYDLLEKIKRICHPFEESTFEMYADHL